MGHVALNLGDVQAKVVAAAVRAGRDPETVTLVCVTKTVDEERIREAFDAGARVFGENRVQEALAKIATGWPGVSWHLIGSLQKNKARHVVGVFDLIHSLDGIELAVEVDRRAAALGVVQKALIEVNIASEASKHGVTPEEALPLALSLQKLSNIEVVGLMCVPPFTDDAEESRPHFIRLRGLLEEINAAGIPMRELSMGMTQDYEVAVEEGATLVRVGTAIFGARAAAAPAA